jgi:hypothetical protein
MQGKQKSSRRGRKIGRDRPGFGFSVEKGANVLEGDSLIISMNSTMFIGKLKFHSRALFRPFLRRNWIGYKSIFFDFCVSSEPLLALVSRVLVTKGILARGNWEKGWAWGLCMQRDLHQMKKGEGVWRR